MTSQQQGPAQKKCRVECQSHKERCTQITALRKAATCSILGCSFVFEGEAHICSVCSAGVCPSCHKRMVASTNVPNDRCSIGGCKLPHGGGSPVELRTGGVRIELAACVVQACAGEGCHQTGTWSELRAHSPWCVAAEVKCPFCEATLKRSDLKKHLTEEHGASLVKTARCAESTPSGDSSDSDSTTDSEAASDSTVTIGTWNIPDLDDRLSVAIVAGRCQQHRHCIDVEAPAQCACPFVIAAAETRHDDEAIPTTCVSVATVFKEVTALRHPMGHCEVSMHAIEKSPCGSLVNSRRARAGAVFARCDGGLMCGLWNCVAATGGTVIPEKRELGVRNAKPRVVFRFTPISANAA
jgi:hypothetical protein